MLKSIRFDYHTILKQPRYELHFFSKILQYLPNKIVEDSAKKYGTNKHSKGIATQRHLVSMLFC